MSRSCWDKIWIDFANKLAKERSVDPKYKIACVIVNEDNTRVLSFGYNGDEHGGNHVRKSMMPGHSGFIHAEENALIKLDYSEAYKKVYVTHSPCFGCCQKLINAKIDELIYDEVYDQKAIDWLKNHPKGKHINIRKYEKHA